MNVKTKNERYLIIQLNKQEEEKIKEVEEAKYFLFRILLRVIEFGGDMMIVGRIIS